ncbi:MAG: sodium:alanine symporter family protein [Deltaproteobacteria bacterium]|nr:sodium:alanine symporter family protein [Deltaproteobacteria bacterium]
MDGIHQGVIWMDGFLWGPPMLVLLLGTHLFLTVRLGFVQRYLPTAIRISFSRKGVGEGDVSQFGALMTALAATIGTGNIVGVATAVALGGPGAVLWCWLTGVFGIATKYAEALLAVKYRVKTADGTMLGGPMYALERGLGQKWLAVLFCVFTAIAAFGIGNMVQANSVASLVEETLHTPTWITGGILSLLTAGVVVGGIRSIARVCERLVPFMAVFYVIGCLVILAMQWQTIGSTVALIVHDAFLPQAAVGGFTGAGVAMSMRYGVARGLFSNESGLGSAPIVAAAARTRNCVRQALVSSTGTFWDTVVVCAITGLVIVNTGAWTSGADGAGITKAAFEWIPVVGPLALTVGLVTFVFSTILGWEYYGERAAEYLLGKRAILPYRLTWVLVVFVGAISKLAFVWDFADAANALMAIPNLVSLLLLSGVLVAETRRYLWSGHLDAYGDSPPVPSQFAS